MTYPLWPFVFLDFIMVALCIFVLYNAYFSPYMVTKSKRFFSLSLFFIFCVYAMYDADYFHYSEALNHSDWSLLHFEDVYYPIMTFCIGNYTLFRIIIWGCALFFVYKSITYFHLPIDLTLLCFIIICASKFAYGRISLAQSICILGLSVIFASNPTRKIHILLGIAIIYLSTFFHTSMLYGICMLIVSFIFRDMGKKHIVILLCLYPVAILYFQMLGGNYIMSYLDSDDNTTSVVQYYLESDFRGYEGLTMIIQSIFERVPVFLLAILVCIGRWKNEHLYWPPYIKILSNMVVFIVLTSSLFSFETNVNTYTLFYRFFNFSLLPSMIVLSYLIVNQYHCRYVNFVFKFSLVGTLYIFLLYTVHAYTGNQIINF